MPLNEIASLNIRLLDGQARSPPPKYLSIDGWQQCLSSESSASGSHKIVCLPSVNPEGCRLSAWEKLDKLKDELTKCAESMYIIISK